MRALLLLPVLFVATSAVALELTSPDIHEGAMINKEQVYTRCGGQNVSPALSWSGAPAATQSFAITAIDLSVKPSKWSHWIVIGLPRGTHSLEKSANLPQGAQALMTDFGDAAYAGPCPPSGSGIHRYQFTVWALDTPTVQFPEHASATDIVTTLAKAALAKTSLTANYQR